ncbi:MAG: ankyrin repeat domain-containing protein [Alphaproteobacteria bacterium]
MAHDYEQERLDSQLMTAIRSGSGHEVKMLLEMGASHKATDQNGLGTVVSAAMSRSPDRLKPLLDAGADPNMRWESDSSGRQLTALMIVAEVGAEKCVQLLLNTGADPDLKDAKGMTALMYACEWGELKTVDALVAGGADIYEVNNDGKSACDIAREKDFKLTAGSDVLDTEIAAKKVNDIGNPKLKQDITVRGPLRFKMRTG